MLPGDSPTWQGKVTIYIVLLPLSLTPSWFPWQQDSVLALLSMLSSSVNVLGKDDVKTHTSLLLELFTTALDYRATQTNVGCTWNHYHSPPTCLASYRGSVWSHGSHDHMTTTMLPWQSWSDNPGIAMTTMITWQDVTNLSLVLSASLIPNPHSTAIIPLQYKYLHSCSEWRPENKAS